MLFWFKELRKRLVKDRVFDLSAQLAYYFLLSFFPFLLLSVTLLAYLPFRSEEILDLIQPFTPDESINLIEMNLSYLLDIPREDILSISVISTIYLATLAFQSMIRILNNAYQVLQSRPLWKNLILGVFLMMGLFVALLISLLLPVFGRMIGEWAVELWGISEWYTRFWQFFRWIASSVILFLVFLFIYKFVPNIPLTFRNSLPGAIFSTFGWQLSSLAFSSYVNLERYSSIYGHLGGVIILLGWFYLTAFILILGGQINAIWNKRQAA